MSVKICSSFDEFEKDSRVGWACTYDFVRTYSAGLRSTGSVMRCACVYYNW